MIARTDRNSFEWSNALLALYDELCTEMKDSEKEELYPKIKELCDKSNVKPGRQQQGIPPDFFWEMNNVELRLRAIFDKSGLQKRVKQDPGSAIGAVS